MKPRMHRMPLYILCLLAVPAWAAGAAGELDTTFDTDGVPITAGGEVFWDAAVQADGKILALGNLYGSSYESVLRRYTTAGTLDTSWGGDGEVELHDSSAGGILSPRHMAIDASGRVVIVGRGSVPGEVTSGKGKNKTTTTELQDRALALRLESDGTLDTSFGIGGLSEIDVPGLDGEFPVAIASQGSTGDLVVAGSATEVTMSGGKGKKGGRTSTKNTLAFVTRLSAYGDVDSSFGTDGYATHDVADVHHGAIGLQSDGSIVIGSRLEEAGVSGSGLVAWAIHRYDGDGTFDSAFGTVPPPDATTTHVLTDLEIDSQDRIVVGGFALNPTINDGDGIVARYTADGELDSSFGSGGAVFANVGVRNDNRNCLIVQADDKPVLGGWTIPSDAVYDAFTVRFTTAGAPDLGFGVDGFAEALPITEAHGAMAMALAPDDSIVQVGIRETRTSTSVWRDGYVARWID